MPNISIISEKRRCTVCIHPERAAIDRLLASGGASQRAIADRFQVGRNALARHHERHVLQAVRNQIARRQEREANSLAEVWSERLEETFAAARRGLARAEDDDERWTNAIGFLSAMNKSCELGLKSAGVIEGGRGTTNVSIEQVIMLPGASFTTAADDSADVEGVAPAHGTGEHVNTIELRALPEPPEKI